MFISNAGVPSEFRQGQHCHKQVLKSSFCRMDQCRSKELVYMYCAETRSVRILRATNSHLLYEIRYGILVDNCQHARVYYVISHNLSLSSLEHVGWKYKQTGQKRIFAKPEMSVLSLRVTEKRVKIGDEVYCLKIKRDETPASYR